MTSQATFEFYLGLKVVLSLMDNKLSSCGEAWMVKAAWITVVHLRGSLKQHLFWYVDICNSV
jgi:hypothetical protein